MTKSNARSTVSQKPDPRADSKFYGELRNVADDLAKRPTGRFGAFGSNEERFRPHTTGGSGSGTAGLRCAFICSKNIYVWQSNHLMCIDNKATQ